MSTIAATKSPEKTMPEMVSYAIEKSREAFAQFQKVALVIANRANDIAADTVEFVSSKINAKGGEVAIPIDLETAGVSGTESKVLTYSKPVVAEKPKVLWKTWMKSGTEAFFDFVSLGATKQMRNQYEFLGRSADQANVFNKFLGNKFQYYTLEDYQAKLDAAKDPIQKAKFQIIIDKYNSAFETYGDPEEASYAMSQEAARVAGVAFNRAEKFIDRFNVGLVTNAVFNGVKTATMMASMGAMAHFANFATAGVTTLSHVISGLSFPIYSTVNNYLENIKFNNLPLGRKIVAMGIGALTSIPSSMISFGASEYLKAGALKLVHQFNMPGIARAMATSTGRMIGSTIGSVSASLLSEPTSFVLQRLYYLTAGRDLSPEDRVKFAATSRFMNRISSSWMSFSLHYGVEVDKVLQGIFGSVNSASSIQLDQNGQVSASQVEKVLGVDSIRAKEISTEANIVLKQVNDSKLGMQQSLLTHNAEVQKLVDADLGFTEVDAESNTQNPELITQNPQPETRLYTNLGENKAVDPNLLEAGNKVPKILNTAVTGKGFGNNQETQPLTYSSNRDFVKGGNLPTTSSTTNLQDLDNLPNQNQTPARLDGEGTGTEVPTSPVPGRNVTNLNVGGQDILVDRTWNQIGINGQDRSFNVAFDSNGNLNGIVLFSSSKGTVDDQAQFIQLSPTSVQGELTGNIDLGNGQSQTITVNIVEDSGGVTRIATIRGDGVNFTGRAAGLLSAQTQVELGIVQAPPAINLTLWDSGETNISSTRISATIDILTALREQPNANVDAYLVNVARLNELDLNRLNGFEVREGETLVQALQRTYPENPNAIASLEALIKYPGTAMRLANAVGLTTGRVDIPVDQILESLPDNTQEVYNSLGNQSFSNTNIQALAQRIQGMMTGEGQNINNQVFNVERVINNFEQADIDALVALDNNTDFQSGDMTYQEIRQFLTQEAGMSDSKANSIAAYLGSDTQATRTIVDGNISTPSQQPVQPTTPPVTPPTVGNTIQFTVNGTEFTATTDTGGAITNLTTSDGTSKFVPITYSGTKYFVPEDQSGNTVVTASYQDPTPTDTSGIVNSTQTLINTGSGGYVPVESKPIENVASLATLNAYLDSSSSRLFIIDTSSAIAPARSYVFLADTSEDIKYFVPVGTQITTNGIVSPDNVLAVSIINSTAEQVAFPDTQVLFVQNGNAEPATVLNQDMTIGAETGSIVKLEGDGSIKFVQSNGDITDLTTNNTIPVAGSTVYNNGSDLLVIDSAGNVTKFVGKTADIVGGNQDQPIYISESAQSSVFINIPSQVLGIELQSDQAVVQINGSYEVVNLASDGGSHFFRSTDGTEEYAYNSTSGLVVLTAIDDVGNIFETPDETNPNLIRFNDDNNSVELLVPTSDSENITVSGIRYTEAYATSTSQNIFLRNGTTFVEYSPTTAGSTIYLQDPDTTDGYVTDALVRDTGTNTFSIGTVARIGTDFVEVSEVTVTGNASTSIFFALKTNPGEVYILDTSNQPQKLNFVTPTVEGTQLTGVEADFLDDGRLIVRNGGDLQIISTEEGVYTYEFDGKNYKVTENNGEITFTEVLEATAEATSEVTSVTLNGQVITFDSNYQAQINSETYVYNSVSNQVNPLDNTGISYDVKDGGTLEVAGLYAQQGTDSVVFLASSTNRIDIAGTNYWFPSGGAVSSVVYNDQGEVVTNSLIVHRGNTHTLYTNSAFEIRNPPTELQSTIFVQDTTNTANTILLDSTTGANVGKVVTLGDNNLTTDVTENYSIIEYTVDSGSPQYYIVPASDETPILITENDGNYSATVGGAEVSLIRNENGVWSFVEETTPTPVTTNTATNTPTVTPTVTPTETVAQEVNPSNLELTLGQNINNQKAEISLTEQNIFLTYMLSVDGSVNDNTGNIINGVKYYSLNIGSQNFVVINDNKYQDGFLSIFNSDSGGSLSFMQMVQENLINSKYIAIQVANPVNASDVIYYLLDTENPNAIPKKLELADGNYTANIGDESISIGSTDLESKSITITTNFEVAVAELESIPQNFSIPEGKVDIVFESITDINEIFKIGSIPDSVESITFSGQTIKFKDGFFDGFEPTSSDALNDFRIPEYAKIAFLGNNWGYMRGFLLNYGSDSFGYTVTFNEVDYAIGNKYDLMSLLERARYDQDSKSIPQINIEGTQVSDNDIFVISYIARESGIDNISEEQITQLYSVIRGMPGNEGFNQILSNGNASQINLAQITDTADQNALKEIFDVEESVIEFNNGSVSINSDVFIQSILVASTEDGKTQLFTDLQGLGNLSEALTPAEFDSWYSEAGILDVKKMVNFLETKVEEGFDLGKFLNDWRNDLQSRFEDQTPIGKFVVFTGLLIPLTAILAITIYYVTNRKEANQQLGKLISLLPKKAQINTFLKGRIQGIQNRGKEALDGVVKLKESGAKKIEQLNNLRRKMPVDMSMGKKGERRNPTRSKGSTRGNPNDPSNKPDRRRILEDGDGDDDIGDIFPS